MGQKQLHQFVDLIERLPLGSKFAAGMRYTYRSLYFPPLIVFGAIMAVTIVTTISTMNSVDDSIRIAGENERKVVESRISEQFETYAQILRGSAGLFNAADGVTPDEWNAYLDEYRFQDEFPGVSSIAYASADMNEKGQIDTVVIELVSRSLQTGEPSPAVGRDIYLSEERRSALDRAVETKQPQLTSQIDLIGADDQTPNEGFILYYPVYTIQSGREILEGFVFTVFTTQGFFDEAFNDAFVVSRDISIRINNFEMTKLYDSDTDIQNPQYIASSLIEIGGTEWIADYRFDEIIPNSQFNTPAYAFVGGTAAAVLVATIVLLLLHARAREIEFEKNRDIDLAKDELLSIASHQLRTPATGVKQYLGLVLQGFAGDITDKQRELLQRAFKSNNRQLDVINEILHLAKIESGRIILSKRDFDMREIVQDVTGDMAQDVQEQEHQLVTKLPKNPVPYNGDSHMIHMSIENLVSNAIKYTPTGGKITVGIKKTSEEIQVYVKDSGIGISDADRDRLFVAFGRIVNDRSRFVSGTGVGLYLVKHLIEMHDGYISVESEPEKGSTFSIHLPRDVR